MAAQEDQHQRIVVIGGLCGYGGLTGRDQVLAVTAGRIGPPGIGQPAAGDGDQPAPRVGRHTVDRPLRGCGDQRLLDRVLGVG